MAQIDQEGFAQITAVEAGKIVAEVELLAEQPFSPTVWKNLPTPNTLTESESETIA